MPERPTILEFVTDPLLLNLTLSPAQTALLSTLYGLPLSAEHVALYRQCTGRRDVPRTLFLEATVVAGARSGKDSRIAAPIVAYEALYGGHERYLARGERGTIVLVAQDSRAARIAFTYVKDYLMRSPLLASLVADVLATELRLTNRLEIVCFPSTQRSLRGYSIPVGVLDELAFFRFEGSADSDAEIQSSIRRGQVGFPHPKLIKISTPYYSSGVLFEDFRSGFGQDNPDLLVWRASSELMNPSLAPQLEREKRRDPIRFEREYMAEFASDLEVFLLPQWIEACVVPDRVGDLPPITGHHYVAGVDPSGGGADAFAVCVVHAEGAGTDAVVVVDAVRGFPNAGGNLRAVVREIAGLVKRYGVREVIGDSVGAHWTRQAFSEDGVQYTVATKDNAAKDKSAAYLELEPLLAQGRLALPDHPLLLKELRLLERRPARGGGRIVIDHPRHMHDDLANSLAWAATLATGENAWVPGSFVASASCGTAMGGGGGRGPWTIHDKDPDTGMTSKEMHDWFRTTVAEYQATHGDREGRDDERY